MSGIKAGVILKQDFCTAGTTVFSEYIKYMDREEAVRKEHVQSYNLYHDYMRNPDKTSGLFSSVSNVLSQEEVGYLKERFQKAQDNDSLMWQTVISFDNRWLDKNGLYDSDRGFLDETKIKQVARDGIYQMLENEKLPFAVWTAAIHYNTDNIHVHVATVEPEPMREKGMYKVYETITKGKQKSFYEVLDDKGQPIIAEQYKGRFKSKSFEKAKSSIVNEILQTRELNMIINHIIRKDIVAHKQEHSLAHDEVFRQGFLELYEALPNRSMNLMNYNNPGMKRLQPMVDALSGRYIEQYHKADYEKMQSLVNRQSELYDEAYGVSDRSYALSKEQDLIERLGNAILKEVKEYAKAIERGGSSQSPPKELLKRESQEDTKRDVANLPHTIEKISHVKSWDLYREGKKCLSSRSNIASSKRGIECLQESSKFGNSWASIALGREYLTGDNVLKNVSQAQACFEKAQEQGNPVASECLKDISKHSAEYRGAAGLGQLDRTLFALKKSMQEQAQEIFSNIREHDLEQELVHNITQLDIEH
ncbi:MAG: MobP2 family relaxase [Lachnospiraceae bacterium]